MREFDLLQAVQPDTGWFAIVGIRGDSRKQVLVETREEADALIAKFTEAERNVFFSVAKFKTGENRTHDNVQSLKAFWVDIDCGKDKAEKNEGYLDQPTGVAALEKFCEAAGLPLPIIVNSGRGIHAYWALTEAVTMEQWNPVAKALKTLCQQHDFLVDPTVFEASRILRVPGTLNFKEQPPKPVEVIATSAPLSYDSFRALVHTPDAPLSLGKPRRALTALGRSMAEAVEFKFVRIIAKKEAGCRQLFSCFAEREELAEPRWFDALSVAKFCTDADSAIHRMSEGHPDYNPDAVEKKIVGIKGPHTCLAFEANNPGGCEGCPHRGKIHTPIVLGKVIPRATPEDNEVEVETEDEEGEVEVSTVTIPDFPSPYFRPKSGGVALPSEEEEGPTEFIVYENDFYVEKVMNNADGYLALCKLHLPWDGVKEFTVPTSSLADPRGARALLASEGVIITSQRNWELLLRYVNLSVREQQNQRRSEKMRQQFGWADKDTKFIVGDREITADGIYHSPPSTTTSVMVNLLQPKGSLDKWKEVFKLYGRPGLELQAFGALSGFGSPLFKFTGQKGIIINLIHPKSGAGKTTIIRMANSIFGDPEELLGIPADTKAARVIKVGILNNIVNPLDEMTNLTAEEYSDLAYAFSQGKGKERAKSSSNELRENNSTWRNITLSSANASMYERLAAFKSTPEGEMMRILEFRVDYTDLEVISTEEGKDIFDHMLNSNYGMAGEVYMQWVIANLDEVKQTLLKVQKKIDKELRLTQRERNYSAAVAANITGGLIAKQLGLIDWDMKRIYSHIGPKIIELRAEVSTPMSTPAEIIADYMIRHYNNMLIVDGETTTRGKGTPIKIPVAEPKGPLLIRIEPDTKLLYLTAKEFKKDCVELQISYRDTLEELAKIGILKEVDTKRIAKGSKVLAPGVRCLVLDCSRKEFLDIEPIIQKVTTDTDED